MKSNRDLTVWKNMIHLKKGRELSFELLFREIRTLPCGRTLSQHKPPIIGDDNAVQK